MNGNFVREAIVVLAVAVAAFLLGRISVSEPPSDSEKEAQAYSKAMEMAEAYIKSKLETVSNQSTAYLHGVPPAPPYHRHKLQIKRQPDEMCSVLYEQRLGYLIEIREGSDFLDYTLIIQSLEGIRDEYTFNGGVLSSAESGWVPNILIPGMLLEMKVQTCGSGGHLDILEVATLPRNY